MEIAEDHTECYTHISDTFTSPLTGNLPGVYREVQYLNNSNVPVYLKDNTNTVQEIRPSGMASNTPHVEIRTRTVLGQRVDYRGFDISKGKHHVIAIPIKTLQERPLYVASTDISVMLSDFLYSTSHPNSQDHRQAEYDKIYWDAMKKAQSAPSAIVANDPTKTYEKLYVLINNNICAVKVTAYLDEDIGDKIYLYYKDVETFSGTHQRCIKSSFEELKKKNSSIWELEGCLLSPDYATLEYYIRNKNATQKEKKISTEEADQHIKNVEEKHKKSQAEKDETIKNQKHKISNMEEYIKQLEELGYSKESAQYQYDKLKYEKEKIAHQQRQDRLDEIRKKIKAAQDLQTTYRKSEDEIWKTATAGIKLIGAALPVILAIYKVSKG